MQADSLNILNIKGVRIDQTGLTLRDPVSVECIRLFRVFAFCGLFGR